MSDFSYYYFASPEAGGNAEIRAGFSGNGVESGVLGLFSGEWSHAVCGNLPLSADVLAVSLKSVVPAEKALPGTVLCRIAVCARHLQRAVLLERFSAIASRMPFIAGDSGGVAFGILLLAVEMQFDSADFGFTAAMEIEAELDLANSDFSGSSSPEPESAVLPNPVSLERQLTSWIAEEMNLTVDDGIMRGQFSPEKSGTAVQFVSRTFDRETDITDYLFRIVIRDISRDCVMERLSTITALLPIYGRFESIKMLCPKAELETIADMGIIKTQGSMELLLHF